MRKRALCSSAEVGPLTRPPLAQVVSKGRIMNALVIAGGSFVLFMALEWVVWRSPANRFFERIARRMVWWIQPYYIIRLVTLGGILLFVRPKLWPVFSKGEGWFYSLGLGLCLIALSFLSLRVSPTAFWQSIRGWYKEDRRSFVQSLIYLVLYPGFVEELMFRWFFTALLWESLGWWTVGVVPVLNIIWHLDYWNALYGFSKQEGGWKKGITGLVAPVTTFAMALTVIAVLTHNLIGPIMAHVFGDWAGLVLQRSPSLSSKIQQS